MTEKLEAKTYITRLYCDKCFQKDGSKNEMKQGEIALVIFSSKYNYTCPVCNDLIQDIHSYPLVVREVK